MDNSAFIKNSNWNFENYFRFSKYLEKSTKIFSMQKRLLWVGIWSLLQGKQGMIALFFCFLVIFRLLLECCLLTFFFWKIDVPLKLLIIHITIGAINFPYRSVNDPTASINYMARKQKSKPGWERDGRKNRLPNGISMKSLKNIIFCYLHRNNKRNFWRGSELFYTPGKWNRLGPYRVLFKGVYRFPIWRILFLVVFRDNSFFSSRKKSPINCSLKTYIYRVIY